MNHPVLQVLALGNIAGFPRADRSDGQLLDSFVHARDGEAFATVVRRHGPMVLAVCRRVLGNHADADDAFQAAFLVLLRKAGSLGTRRPLGPWLHGVAFNTARRLQRANRRRAANERTVAELPERAASEAVSLSAELLAILDEELSRLPERYRVPIVLCDLEGLTRREVAVRLGCPEGTVAGRLARARELLATRVAARGVVPSAGVLAILLTQRCLNAVTPDRVDSVVRVASGGAVPARVSFVVERVVASMLVKKVKSLAAVLLLCGLIVAAGFGLRNEAVAGTEPAAPPEEKVVKTAPAAEKVLTVIPLRKLDAVETAATITDTFKGKGVVVAPIPDERSLLLYADTKTTREVQALLVKLGDSSGKSASLIKLDRTTDCRDASRVLTEVFNGPKAGASSRVTVVPVPDENAILVYATPIDTLTIKNLLSRSIDSPRQPVKEVAKPAAGEQKKVVGEEDSQEFLVYSLKWKRAREVVAELKKRGADADGSLRIVADYTSNSIVFIGPVEKALLAKKLAEEIDRPESEAADTLTHACKFRDATVVADLLKTRMGSPKPEEAFAIGVDARTNSVIVTGRPERLATARKIIEDFDNKPQRDDRKEKIGDLDLDGRPDIVIVSQPELRKYNVLPGTADALAKVLQKEMPALRVIALRQSNQLMVLATPNEHSALTAKFTEFIVDDDSAPEAVTILLSRSDEGITDKLRKLFPDTKIKPGELNKPSISVKGTSEQIKAVRDAIAVIEGRVKKE